MSNPISIATVATQTELSARRIREICAKHNIGSVIPGIKGRILSVDDIPTILSHRGKVGNPHLGKDTGNNGGGKKAAKSKRKTANSKKSKK